MPLKLHSLSPSPPNRFGVENVSTVGEAENGIVAVFKKMERRTEKILHPDFKCKLI